MSRRATQATPAAAGTRGAPLARLAAAPEGGAAAAAAAGDTAAVTPTAPLPWTRLRALLLAHHRRHARPLPWRESRDPYRVWVSEIMLQQTQADTVAPRYAAFLRLFPSVAALAASDEHAVLAAWAGLGYYRRARHLHRGARQVMADFGGRLPASVSDLRRLAGVGPYTAGAIASIAFGLPAPLVDGNVERVLARVMALEVPADAGAGKQQIWASAAALVEGPDPGALNEGLMDLGATICRPRAPTCLLCPWRTDCRAAAASSQTSFPLTAKARPRQPLPMAMAYAAGGGAGRSGDGAGSAWLGRRPLAGLWAGLWELPSAEGRGAKARLAAALGQPLGRCIAEVSHTLTHRDVTARIYLVARPRWRARAQLKPFARPEEAPLSALARKALAAARAAVG